MFSTTIATAADGSNNTTYLTLSTSATVPLGSVSTTLTSLSSKENTSINNTIPVSFSVTAAVTATSHTSSGALSTTGTTETSVATTSATTPSVTAQAFSHSSIGNTIKATITRSMTPHSNQSNYISTSTTVPSVSTPTLMSSGSVLDQSSSTVKSTVTAQSKEDPSTATIAPSVSSTIHFSSQESSASVKSDVTVQASSTNITNPMVASVQSNSTTENTVSAAENSYNSVTATISNTPMASSYKSPSLVTKFLVSSLSVESLTPIPSAGGTTVVSVDTSSHFKPSDSTISHTNSSKMSSLFVSSSATVLNVNSSSFTLVHPSPTSQAVVPTSTSSRPTTPVEGVKTVSMEMTLDLTFEDDYKNPNSKAYKDLTTNLTRSLEKTYKNIEGFIGIRILLIRKGSVVCMYIVILAKDSKADEEMLKNTLEKASKDKTFGFKVTSVKVEEEPTAKPEEKLPNWALITMIALGSLSFVFLVTVICVCVS